MTERILKVGETFEDAARRLHAENKILHEALGSHEGPEGETPYEKREKMVMKMMKLWVVQLEPAMDGPRMLAEEVLRTRGIAPVEWNSSGMILIPPGLPAHFMENRIATMAFNFIKEALEAGRKYRVEQEFPYGLKG